MHLHANEPYVSNYSFEVLIVKFVEVFLKFIMAKLHEIIISIVLKDMKLQIIITQFGTER